MNCPTCNAPIPDFQLVCPACTERRSYQGLLTLQKEFLPRLLDGQVQLQLSKPKEETAWHLVLVGSWINPRRVKRPKRLKPTNSGGQAWCGRMLSPAWKQQRLAYPQINLSTVCNQCRAAFDRLAEELSPEAA